MRMVLSDVRKKVSPHVLTTVLQHVLAMGPPHVQGILNEAFFYYF